MGSSRMFFERGKSWLESFKDDFWLLSLPFKNGSP